MLLTKEIFEPEIKGLIVYRPAVHADDRGYFFESFSEQEFSKIVGHNVSFVQDNESRSAHGVVRGLHFQRGEHAQAKLVRCTLGEILDVAVDLRRNSPTFGRHFAVKLSDENHRQLFIPRGFAHGFSVLSHAAVVQYKCDNPYCPESESGVAWNDPAIGIDWQVAAEHVQLSLKDQNRPTLARLATEIDLF
jgi:dTDP-4-dehydrorhamnose 3,5-epimerase